MNSIQRPLQGEYGPNFQKYVDMVPDGDFTKVLSQNTQEAIRFFQNIPAGKYDHRYAVDKFTIKEVLIHIIDVERVMAYRALVAARADNKTILYKIDVDLYVQQADGSRRAFEDIVDEFKIVRAATEKFFETVTESQSIFPATTTTHPVTARALGYIIIGHLMHHMIIMKEKYLQTHE